MRMSEIRKIVTQPGYYIVTLQDGDPDFKVGTDIMYVKIFEGFLVKIRGPLLVNLNRVDSEGYGIIFEQAVVSIKPLPESFWKGLIE